MLLLNHFCLLLYVFLTLYVYFCYIFYIYQVILMLENVIVKGKVVPVLN